jgi:formylglycine-generating enzyme required for sulfatase activity
LLRISNRPIKAAMKSKRDFWWGPSLLRTAVFLFVLSLLPAVAAPPVVSNVRASQRLGTHYVDIHYNVSDADGNSPLTVYVHISADGGATWNVPVFTLAGAVGPGVTPGNDRHIVWSAGVDWPGQFNSQCRVRIVADDHTVRPPPAGMAYIPAGAFQMGDSFNEGGTDERPRHTVFVSAFFMDKTLVTRELWLAVRTWGEANAGYAFVNAGAFTGANHPVRTINWYDAVKWCNARSEREGLTPCYYTDAGLKQIYKTGQTAPYVKWNANGYRLPTEAEWEKAARGGLSGRRFPWGDTITHSQANYYSSANYAYDISPTRGYHPTAGTTSPVGAFPANAYGLHDMAGNLWEWCWDWYDANWYANSQATQDNTRGPASGTSRLLRGGCWYNDAYVTRCALRNNGTPSLANNNFGFRCLRGL